MDIAIWSLVALYAIVWLVGCIYLRHKERKNGKQS
jgi:hypothetical protein